jgi:hypothetical protein
VLTLDPPPSIGHGCQLVLRKLKDLQQAVFCAAQAAFVDLSPRDVLERRVPPMTKVGSRGIHQAL